MPVWQFPTPSALFLDRVSLLAPHSFQARVSCMCAHPNGCAKQYPVVLLIGSISGLRGSLYASYGVLVFLLNLTPGGVAEDVLLHPAGWPENLDGAPAHHPQCRGKLNNCAHEFLWSWVVSSTPRELL